MNGPLCRRGRPGLSRVLALCLFAIVSAGAPALAQYNCPNPSPSLTISQPADGATIGGVIRIDISAPPPPSGWSWYGTYTVTILDTVSGQIVEQGVATNTSTTTAYYEWDSSIWVSDTGVRYQIQALTSLWPAYPNLGYCPIGSNEPTVGVVSPSFDRNSSSTVTAGVKMLKTPK